MKAVFAGLTLAAAASALPRKDTVNECSGRDPVPLARVLGLEEACDVSECRATHWTTWLSFFRPRECLRAPTCEEIQASAWYNRNAASACVLQAEDPEKSQLCFQTRKGFPFAVTARYSSDETCESTHSWNTFCVTEEATESSKAVVRRVANFRGDPSKDELFAIAAYKADCPGLYDFATPLNPYDKACGETYAGQIMQGKVNDLGGSLKSLSITVDDMDRKYFLYTPATVVTDKPAPLVVEIHGLTSCAEYLSTYTGWMETAAENGAVMAWPQSTELDGLNPLSLSFEKRLSSWNAGYLPVPSEGAEIDDTKFIVNMVKSLIADNIADASRIYMAGHSNGAAMAQRVAFEHSDLVTAVATHSLFLTSIYDPEIPVPDGVVSLQPGNPQTLRFTDWQVPAFHVHGLNDTTIPYNPLVCDGTDPTCLSSPGAFFNNILWGLFDDCDVSSPVATSTAETNLLTYKGCKGNDTFVNEQEVEVSLLTHLTALHAPFQGAKDANGETITVDTAALAWEFVSRYTRKPAAP